MFGHQKCLMVFGRQTFPVCPGPKMNCGEMVITSDLSDTPFLVLDADFLA